MTDRVIFRKWNKRNGGDVIAILPDNASNRGTVDMYEHVGQHEEGDYYEVMVKSKLATQAEYQDLLEELTGMGYDLRVMQRLNS